MSARTEYDLRNLLERRIGKATEWHAGEAPEGMDPLPVMLTAVQLAMAEQLTLLWMGLGHPVDEVMDELERVFKEIEETQTGRAQLEFDS